MKKIIVVLGVLALILTTPSITASASCRGGRAVRMAYTLCTVEDCSIVGNHTHDGTTYCGHYYGDGHDYHLVCEIEDCTEITSHYHDEIMYLPNSSNAYGYCGLRRYCRGYY